MSSIRERTQRALAAGGMASSTDVHAALDFVLRVTEPEMRARIAAVCAVECMNRDQGERLATQVIEILAALGKEPS